MFQGDILARGLHFLGLGREPATRVSSLEWTANGHCGPENLDESEPSSRCSFILGSLRQEVPAAGACSTRHHHGQSLANGEYDQSKHQESRPVHLSHHEL